jgi:hypothetical protein
MEMDSDFLVFSSTYSYLGCGTGESQFSGYMSAICQTRRINILDYL